MLCGTAGGGWSTVFYCLSNTRQKLLTGLVSEGMV